MRGAHAQPHDQQRARGGERREDAPLERVVVAPAGRVGLVEQPPHEQQQRPTAGQRDRGAVAAREVEGLVLAARPDEEQHAAATSITAASTKLNAPNALTLRCTNSSAPSGTYVCWYQGSNSVTSMAAAARPALRSSGGSSRRRASALTRGADAAALHRLHQHPRVGLGDGPQLALEGERPVLGRPLADVLEPPRRRARRAGSRRAPAPGSAANRHGYGSGLPGLPGHTGVRSSNMSDVSRSEPANAFTRVR